MNNNNSALGNSEHAVLSRDQHCISRKNISQGCLRVLYTLNDSGYQAYIVGGAVRDLLLGKKPKDFDVATNATPEQVKAQFRHARIIGRRFRIVHVTMGREIIEVSTFRGTNTESIEIQGEKLSRKVKHIESAHSESGMILRDNVYGTLEEDVQRRDFTVNALYYTVRNFEVA
ncbi:MAG: polynucleotide adenylyltransferase PcnB, partial [Gammaproteobacteria bacterium]